MWSQNLNSAQIRGQVLAAHYIFKARREHYTMYERFIHYIQSKGYSPIFCVLTYAYMHACWLKLIPILQGNLSLRFYNHLCICTAKLLVRFQNPLIICSKYALFRQSKHFRHCHSSKFSHSDIHNWTTLYLLTN